MSIIIKGIDMPKTHLRNVIIAPDGKIVTEDEEGITYGLRKGTATQLPPHGRLIDADALEEYCEREAGDKWSQKAGTLWSYAFEEFKDIVYNRETIIEAEEVKK